MPNVTLIEQIDFRVGGNSRDYVVSGFSHPERNRTWAIAPGCTLRLPTPCNASSAVLVFRVQPLTERSSGPGCRMSILIDGEDVFDDVIERKMAIGLAVANLSTRNRFINVEFIFSSAPRPAELGLPQETRHLAMSFHSAQIFACLDDWAPGGSPRSHGHLRADGPATAAAVEVAVAMTVDNLLASFESLGHSCDFGLAQREVGIEPLGLLRFTGISTLLTYVGLLERFSGLGEQSNIRPYVPEHQHEYWIHEIRYGMYYHTFIPQTQAAPEQLVAREMQRLPFLRRKFIEDLENGEKIFFLRRPDPMTAGEALAIWAALNTYHDNVLLYLEPSDCVPAGVVEEIAPRLLKGYLDGTLGEVAPSLATWLCLCGNAYLACRPPIGSRHLESEGEPPPPPSCG